MDLNVFWKPTVGILVASAILLASRIVFQNKLKTYLIKKYKFYHRAITEIISLD